MTGRRANEHKIPMNLKLSITVIDELSDDEIRSDELLEIKGRAAKLFSQPPGGATKH